ncbi:MAG TPA: TonB-dependent receptor [Caulobacteraceae bacterium]|jgi:outer membrane receptor protein involved in Fe transport|nr:TonB-dependent receptor [Caulobacteraceae bacterium]
MRRSHLIGLLATASAFALAAPAFAADAPPSQPNTVQEVIVTAEKKPEAVKDVPLSITAVPQSQLEKLQAVNFSDYTKLVPGLSIESAGPGDVRLTLRGLNAGGVGSTVAIYVDETPFGSSSGLVDGAIFASDFDTFDMNRIEVLRGPQGTLYGSNTEGGLVKFVTNAPVNHYEAAVEAGYESTDHGSTGWDLKGMVNVPLGDTLALRVDAYHAQLPGYIDNKFLGLSDINKGDKSGGRIQLEWKPTDRLSVRLSAFGQNMKLGGSGSEEVFPATFTPVFGDYVSNSYIPLKDSFQYREYNGTIKYDLGFADLTSSTSYGQVHVDLLSDFTSQIAAPGLTYGQYVDLLIDPHFGVTPPTALPYDNKVNDDKFTQEVRLQSPKADNGFEWLVGGYYTRETGVLNQHVQVSDIGSDKIISAIPDLEDPLLTSSYREWAAFGDLTYHITPKWEVQAGGRYSDQTQSAHETVSGLLVGNTSPPPYAIDITTDSKSDVATWSLGTKYHLTDDAMIYARYATGYRPGGPNVVPPSAPPGTPFTYGADKNRSYEAGIKTSWDDRHVTLDADVFYVDWRNIQLFEVVNGYGVNGNGGKAMSEGYEWALAWVPMSGLTFTWNGAHTNAALTSDAPGVHAFKGDSLPMVPKFSTAVDGEYDWTVWSDTTAFIGATLAYQTSMSSDFDSTAGDTRSRIPGYDTVDFRAGLDLPEKMRVELWGKNITGTKGFTSYGGGAPGKPGAAFGGGTSIGIIQPATWGVTVSKKF